MEFLKDVESGLIADIIDEALESILLRKTGKSEYNSWENSLQRMYHVLNDASIPNDSGIAVEYNIPRTSNRIDMLISGYDKDENGSLIVVELKQWEKIKVLQMDGMIGTWFMRIGDFCFADAFAFFCNSQEKRRIKKRDAKVLRLWRLS